MKRLFSSIFLLLAISTLNPISAIAFEDGDTTKPLPKTYEGEVFTVVERMPIFPGCEDSGNDEETRYCTQKNLLEYIYQNIVYPKAAKQKGIEGMVVASMTIEKDGSVSNVKVLRGIGFGCEEEVVSVLESMNNMEQKWTPGYQRNQAMRVRYNVPVRFNLTPKEKEVKVPFKND